MLRRRFSLPSTVLSLDDNTLVTPVIPVIPVIPVTPARKTRKTGKTRKTRKTTTKNSRVSFLIPANKGGASCGERQGEKTRVSFLIPVNKVVGSPNYLLKIVTLDR